MYIPQMNAIIRRNKLLARKVFNPHTNTMMLLQKTEKTHAVKYVDNKKFLQCIFDRPSFDEII